MIEKIKDLEVIARQLDPSERQRSNWTEKVTSYTNEYLDNISELNAYQPDSSSATALDEYPINENGYPIETLIELVRNSVDKPGINPASGGHLGYIPGGGLYPSALGDLMADVSNQYAGIHF